MSSGEGGRLREDGRLGEGSGGSAAGAAVPGGRLGSGDLERLLAGVDEANAAARRAWPGPSDARQPIQVLYVPADRVTATTARDMGDEARRLVDTHLPDADALAAVFDLPSAASGPAGADRADAGLAQAVRERLVRKLEAEPVEDLRVDLEDGYLGHAAEVEDRHATVAGRAVGRSYLDGTAPPFVGLRIKSFADAPQRSVMSLDRFLSALLDEAGRLPDGFVVTLPKIVAVEHVAAFARVLRELETAHGLDDHALRFEAQIETAASVIDGEGRLVPRRMLAASDGRLVAAHVGVYDYTAGLGLPPAEQRLSHPALDWLRSLLQVTFAGTQVRLSDGSTNAVPADDSTDELHRVWRQHGADVRHSLRHGYVQGWDLHPSHLVSRYVVVFASLLEGIDDVIDRLSRWHGTSEGGGVLDEPATVRQLEAHLHRALVTGALDRSALAGTPLEGWPAIDGWA